ncbi:MAG: hypothetical protein ACKVVP_20255 [Chloroflexota bacterium]
MHFELTLRGTLARMNTQSGAPRRGFQRRPITARSPLEGRQLWRIGDWGGASEQVGKQWEALGARALASVIGQPRPGPDGDLYVPREAVVISSNPDLAAQVQANGKPHADALLVGTLNGDVILEPVDFKWTLETAQIKQVSIPVLQALLDEPPPLLHEAIHRAVARVRPDSEGEPRLHDGIFLAPDTSANRAHLAPRGTMDPAWAALVPVDWAEFFPPLIGWHMALQLARIERTTIGTLEQAERYYRLGAGVRGGLSKLASGIFSVDPGDLDHLTALDELQRNHKLRGVPDVIAHLDGVLTTRAELVQKLRSTERGVYPFGRFAADLKTLGIETKGEDRQWRVLYGGVMKQLGARIRAEGQAYVHAGKSEPAALVALADRGAEWLALARQLLKQDLTNHGSGTMN